MTYDTTTVYVMCLFNGKKKLISELNELQRHRIAKVLDARFQIQGVLRVLAKVFNIPAQTSLPSVWSDILFEMLQSSCTGKDNQLFWYVDFNLQISFIPTTSHAFSTYRRPKSVHVLFENRAGLPQIIGDKFRLETRPSSATGGFVEQIFASEHKRSAGLERITAAS